MGSMLRCLAILAAMLPAQANLTIRGQVTDVTGTVVPGVEVLVTNTQLKQIPRLTVTGESGNYALPRLPASQYAVRIELSGFMADRKEINLIEGAPNTVDFTLTVSPVDAMSADAIRLTKAERIAAQMWQFSMQRSGFAPGNGKWRAEELRKQAFTKQLRALDKDAIPSLVLALTDPDVQMRRNAALLLMDLAGGVTAEAAPKTDIRPALQDLIRALEDPDPNVRVWSAQAMGYIGPDARSALPSLVKLLTDPDDDVRRFAQSAIAKIQKK